MAMIILVAASHVQVSIILTTITTTISTYHNTTTLTTTTDGSYIAGTGMGHISVITL